MRKLQKYRNWPKKKKKKSKSFFFNPAYQLEIAQLAKKISIPQLG